jgi:hypothetical protein
MKTYQITLPDEFAAFVDRMIAEKKWDTPDLLVMYALSSVMTELASDEMMTPEEVEELRKQIQVGIDASERGEVGPLDWDEIDRLVKEKLAAEREAAHAGSGTQHRG